MRTIIVVRGKEMTGKSPAIMTVYQELSNKYKTVKGPVYRYNGKDITAALEIPEIPTAVVKKRIGIESAGDPGTGLYQRLMEHVNDGCDVILTASRTQGYTVPDIKKAAQGCGYEIIWTSHYQNNAGTGNMPNGPDLNQQFAKSMVNLILSLL